MNARPDNAAVRPPIRMIYTRTAPQSPTGREFVVAYEDGESQTFAIDRVSRASLMFDLACSIWDEARAT